VELTAVDQLAECLAVDMRLVTALPNHCQVPEMRARISAFKAERPEVYALARIAFRAAYEQASEVLAASDAQLARDLKSCGRCKGTGEFVYQARVRGCGCGAKVAGGRGEWRR
jgi:hypothetical protein